MKKRKRRAIILFCERYFSESVRRRPCELAIAVIVKHLLEICASARSAIEISIAFAKREVSVRSAGTPRIIVEIFLIFRDRQIVELASEQAVSVLELTLISPLSIALGPLRRILLRGQHAAQEIRLPAGHGALPAPTVQGRRLREQTASPAPEDQLA